MPVHEYQCTSCSHRFNRKFDYEGVITTVCPECKGKARMVFTSAETSSVCTGCSSVENDSTYDSCETTYSGFG